MKKLELRAYSPVNKEMYYDVDPNYHFEIWGTTIDYTPHLDDDSLTHFSTADDKNTPEFIEVTEFTGIKDIAGKKIFENDIVRKNGNQLTVIKWTGFGFNGVYINDDLSFDDEHEDRISHRDKFELLGNIYENPEIITNP